MSSGIWWILTITVGSRSFLPHSATGHLEQSYFPSDLRFQHFPCIYLQAMGAKRGPTCTLPCIVLMRWSAFLRKRVRSIISMRLRTSSSSPLMVKKMVKPGSKTPNTRWFCLCSPTCRFLQHWNQSSDYSGQDPKSAGLPQHIPGSHWWDFAG